MSVSGSGARLTLSHLAKDDEGLYTLRIFTKDGTAEHSAYLFVSGRTQINQESNSFRFQKLNINHKKHSHTLMLTVLITVVK